MKNQMKKIEEALASHVQDDDEDGLEEFLEIQGASEDDIAEFEKELELILPDSVKELYRYRNGGPMWFRPIYAQFHVMNPIAFSFMSLEQIQKKKKTFCSENKLMTDFPDFFSEEDIDKLDKRIKPYLFNKRWIPFGEGSGMYLMLDLDPAEDGDVGQIIAYVHDPDFIYYVAGNISDVLSDTVKYLNDDWYEEINGY